MQSQDMASKVAVKVKKKTGFESRRKKIKDSFNILIQDLEESRRIWNVF